MCPALHEDGVTLTMAVSASGPSERMSWVEGGCACVPGGWRFRPHTVWGAPCPWVLVRSGATACPAASSVPVPCLCGVWQ